MSVTTIILITLTTIIVVNASNDPDPHPAVCNVCNADSECIDANGEDGDAANPFEYCHNFGGDIGKRCYWKDEDNPYEFTFSARDNNKDYSRICESDYQCFKYELDYWGFGGFDQDIPINVEYVFPDLDARYSCVRCCKNGANKGLCTATIGSDKEPCGVISQHSQSEQPYDYTTDAPCCDGEICLDQTIGICGVEVTDPCSKCIVWNYILGDYIAHDIDQELEYISQDNCGEGLICLPNSDKPNLYKPGSDMGGDIVYNEGVCIPNSEDGTLGNSSCDTDEECNGCMRCCGGQCKRIKGESCGFKKGACCYNDICKDNICKTPTASPTAAPLTASPTAAPLTASPTTAPLTVSPTPAPSHTIILTKPPTKDD
eukprot:916693_1